MMKTVTGRHLTSRAPEQIMQRRGSLPLETIIWLSLSVLLFVILLYIFVTKLHIGKP